MLRNILIVLIVLVSPTAFSQNVNTVSELIKKIDSLQNRVLELETSALLGKNGINVSSNKDQPYISIANERFEIIIGILQTGPIIRLLDKDSEDKSIFLGIDDSGNLISMVDGEKSIDLSSDGSELGININNGKNSFNIESSEDEMEANFIVIDGDRSRKTLNLTSKDGFGRIGLSSQEYPPYKQNTIYPGSKILSKSEWLELKFSTSYDYSYFVNRVIYTQDIQLKVIPRYSNLVRKYLLISDSEKPALLINAHIQPQPSWANAFRGDKINIEKSQFINEFIKISNDILDTLKQDYVILFQNSDPLFEDYDLYINYFYNNNVIGKYNNGDLVVGN